MPAECPATDEPLARFPPDLWNRLVVHAQARTYRPGEAVFAQGDQPEAFYLVIEGWVKLVRVTAHGGEHILCVRGPGEHFCPVSLLDRGPQLGTAVAMGDVRLLSLGEQAFSDLCRKCPQLLLLAQGDCLAEVRRLLHRVEAVTFRSVRQRVAHALLSMSPPGTDAGRRGPLRMTQQELGGLIGASRESVSRALAHLEHLGGISVSRARVQILDRAVLERVAASEEAERGV